MNVSLNPAHDAVLRKLDRVLRKVLYYFYWRQQSLIKYHSSRREVSWRFISKMNRSIQNNTIATSNHIILYNIFVA